jgi:hypothetical protein
MQAYKASYYKHVSFSFAIDFCLKMKEQYEGLKKLCFDLLQQNMYLEIAIA